MSNKPRATSPGKFAENDYKQWTGRDKAYLIAHWGHDMRRTAIARHLKRSREACQAMARLLDLRLNGEDWRLDVAFMHEGGAESEAA